MQSTCHLPRLRARPSYAATCRSTRNPWARLLQTRHGSLQVTLRPSLQPPGPDRRPAIRQVCKQAVKLPVQHPPPSSQPQPRLPSDNSGSAPP